MDKVFYTNYDSPIGELVIARSRHGLSNIAFGSDKTMDDWIPDHDNRLLGIAKRELDEYFAGERTYFSLPLDISGSAFTTLVLIKCMEIEYGQTTTYGKLAAKAGSENASRAVGSVMAKNKLPIIIPCHRVLPKDNSIGNYSGGSDIKKYLLELEKRGNRNED